MKLLRDSVILFFGVLLAAFLTPSITYDEYSTLFLVAVILAVFNLFLKPLLIVFALPFVILTLGLGLWIINALLLYFAGHLVDAFNVPSFGSAMIGSIFISLVNVFASILLNPKRIQVKRSSSPTFQDSSPRRGRRSAKRDDDVIDV